MTLITQNIDRMRGILNAAADRPLTKAQTTDFREAQREVMDFVADAYDVDSVRSLTTAIKAAPEGLSGLVDGLETWHRTKGRKSAGRAIVENDGPVDGSSFSAASNAGVAYGTKSLDWGADFIKARSMAGKALLEVGSTAVESPIFGEAIADPRAARQVYQLMPSSEAEGGSFSYLAQTVRTNNAAEVATGALKPTSVFTLERVNDTTKVFAHLTQALDRYLLEDAPNLRQFLDTELRYGLAKAFDAHVISDINAATDLGTAGTLDLAGVRSAITELQEEDIEPDAIVMQPSLWATIEDEATTTFASNDNAPAATEALNRRLYGIPVVVTNSAITGEALVGDFRGSARIFRTGSASITVHDSQPRDVTGTLYSDAFLNQLVLRAEMRAEVAVWRPAGFRRVSEAS